MDARRCGDHRREYPIYLASQCAEEAANSARRPARIGEQGAELGRIQALLVIQRIHRQRLARLRASDQIVEIAIDIAGPDLPHDYGGDGNLQRLQRETARGASVRLALPRKWAL